MGLHFVMRGTFCCSASAAANGRTCSVAGLARLDLQDRHFTLGSLRSGGATYHFRTYENLATLQYLGRWARADTLRYYLHEALTVKVEAESTSEAKAQLEYVMQHVALLQHPPGFSAAPSVSYLFLRLNPQIML